MNSESSPLFTLSDQALSGRTAYLMRAAEAADWTVKSAPIPNRKRPSLFTYFIGCEVGPLKIGIARCAYQRLQTLQTANPSEMFLYAYAPGGLDLERQLHREFKEYRIRGEWFERSEPILRRIILWQQTMPGEIA